MNIHVDNFDALRTKSMLIGEYQHAVDEKGRIALPAKFRKSLTEGVVVTKGLDPCLHLYPIDQWRRFAEKITQLPTNKLGFVRMMLSQASHCDIDSQGRILVPSALLEKAGIKHRAIIVGLHIRGELWSEERWQEYLAKMENEKESIAEELGELNLL